MDRDFLEPLAPVTPPPASSARTTDLRHALRRALKQPKLVLLLWACHLVLAALVAVPLAARLAAHLGPSEAGDALLFGPAPALLVEIARAEGGAVSLLGLLVAVVVLLTLLASPALAAGTLEVLASSDGRPGVGVPAAANGLGGSSSARSARARSLGHRFGRGVGHFYGRLLRQGVVAVPVALVAVVLAAGPLLVVARRFGERGRETLAFVLQNLALLGAGLALLWVLLALDLARVAVVREDRRDAIRCFWRALLLVLRHPLALAGRWLGLTALLALVAWGAAVARLPLPVATTWGLVATVILHQLVLLARATERVALWEVERQLLACWRPAVGVAPTAAQLAPPAGAVPPGSAADLHQAVEVAPVALQQHVFGGFGGDRLEDRGAERAVVAGEVTQRVDAVGEETKP